MSEEENSKDDNFFEDLIKKTKTGVTFPKSLREELFEEGKEYYFKLIVPADKEKIILEILPEDKVKELSEKLKTQRKSAPRAIRSKEPGKVSAKTPSGPTINWGEIFAYEFEAKESVMPILEMAFKKFSETPINFEDAMGRIKYSLITYLSSTKTENAKLYFSIEKFLIKIIELFDLPNLIDWIFDKIVPNIESKFLYELALLELVGISLQTKRFEKAEVFIFHVLVNIDSYTKLEMYNIMNSFKQLVNKIRVVERGTGVQRTAKIDFLLKEKLMEYGEDVEDNNYKIQIVEFLEDLNYIELAYKLAKKIQLSLPPESLKLEEVRKLVRRLHAAPVSEQKGI